MKANIDLLYRHIDGIRLALAGHIGDDYERMIAQAIRDDIALCEQLLGRRATKRLARKRERGEI